MATIDPADGILKWQNGDVTTPLATKMNLHLDSVGQVTNALKRTGLYRVNNIPERTALVNTIGVANISNANPLRVWRANAPVGRREEFTENGGNWDYVKTSAERFSGEDTNFAGGITGTIRYSRTNSIVTVWYNFVGVNTSDLLVYTLPPEYRSSRGAIFPASEYIYTSPTPRPNPVYLSPSAGTIRIPPQGTTTRRTGTIIFDADWGV